MIRFSNYISIVFRKAVPAFDLSMLVLYLMAVSKCFRRNSTAATSKSDSKVSYSLTNQNGTLTFPPANTGEQGFFACLPKAKSPRMTTPYNSVFKIFVSFPDTSRQRGTIHRLQMLLRTDQRQLM